MSLKRVCESGWTILLISTVLLSFAGCASSPDMRRNDERGPEQVMGAPPSVESEDYEFAPPPVHPGEHGRVGQSVEPGKADRAGRSEGVVSRADLKELLRLGPSTVFTHVDVEPYRADGEFVGFRIIDASDAALAVISPRLRVGDIVTHVNQKRLERPDDYVQIWEKLGEAQEVRIDFMRGGERQQAIWEIE